MKKGKIKFSFCITCKGRRANLETTMRRNLADNPEPWVEFVVLDYSSDDGLEGWVRSEFKKEIESGRVVYCAAKGIQFYDSAHAKNVAHKLGGGEIVCNLDSDNFTGPGFAKYVTDLFNAGAGVVASNATNGSHGRISIRKADFLALGGYDEGLKGYGWDDNDFRERATRKGNKVVFIDKRFCETIDEGANRTEFMLPDHRDRLKSNESNKARSRQNCRDGKLVANLNRPWGSLIVKRNFTEFVET
jgi:hypothetical protein